MGALEDELDDHGVVGVMQRDELVALVRERGAGGAEVLPHLLLAVEDLPRGDDLVARVLERPDRGVEVGDVLGFHVLADDGLAAAAIGHGRDHRCSVSARRRSLAPTSATQKPNPRPPRIPCVDA